MKPSKKKRKFARTLLIIIVFFFAIVISLMIILGIYLQTDAFSRFARKKAMDFVHSKVNRDVRINNIAVSLFPFRVIVKHFILYGPKGSAEVAFCHLETVKLSLDLKRLLHKELIATALELDNAEINIIFYKEGGDNFVRWKSQEKKNKSFISFEVQNVIVTSMKVMFKHEGIPLVFSTPDLNSVFIYDKLAKGFKTHLIFNDAILKIRDFNDWNFNSEMKFIARGKGLDFDFMRFFSPGIEMVTYGTMVDFKKRIFDLDVFIKYRGEFVKHWFLIPTTLKGDGVFIGTYKGTFSKFNVDGQFYVKNFRIYNFNYDVIAGKFKMNEDDLLIPRMYGRLAQGNFEGSFHISPLHGISHFTSKAAFVGARVEDFSKWFGVFPLMPVGKSDFLGDLQWDEGGFKQFKGSFYFACRSGEIKSENYYERINSFSDPIEFPANGYVKGTLENYGIKDLKVSAKSSFSDYTVGGTIDFHGNLKLSAIADTKNLKEVDLMYHIIESKIKNTPIDMSDLWEARGENRFIGKVEDSLSRIKFGGDFKTKNFEFRNVNWGNVTGTVMYRDRVFNLKNINVVKDDNSFSAAYAIFNLGKTGFSKDGDISTKINFIKYESSDILKALKWDFPLKGALRGQITLAGATNDLKIDSDIRLFNALLFNHSLDSVSLSMKYENRKAQIIDAVLRAKNAQIQGTAGINIDTYALEGANVSFKEFPLKALADQWRIDAIGKISGKINAEGDLNHLTGDVAVNANDLSLSGVKLGDLELKGHAEKGIMNFSLLKADPQKAIPLIQADLTLNSVPPYHYSFHTSFKNYEIPIPLSTLYKNAKTISSALTAEAVSTGDLEDYQKTNLVLNVPAISLNLQNFKLKNTDNISIFISPKSVALAETKLLLDSYEFAMKGNYDLNKNILSSLFVKGNIDLKLAEDFFPDIIAGGQGNVQIEATNVRNNVIYEGKLFMSDGTLKYKKLPLLLTSLKGMVNFNKEEISFKDVLAKGEGGDIDINGVIKLKDSQFNNFSIKSGGRNVRFNYPAELVSYGNFSINWFGTLESSLISGNIEVEQAFWNREVTLATMLTEKTKSSTEYEKPGSSNEIKLNLHITAPKQVEFDAKFGNLEVNLDEKVDLFLVNTAEKPVLLGRASTNTGTILFLGNEFKVNKGIIDLINPIETTPQLDFLAEAHINEYLIKLMINGTLDKFLFQFASEPPLSQTDIWALVSGQKIQPGAAYSKTTKAEDAAIAAIGSSYLTSPILGTIQEETKKILGLNKLEISPTYLSTETNPSAKITLSKYVTKSVAITYSTDLTSYQDQVILIEIQISPGVIAVASRNEYGYYGLDFRLNKTF